MPPIDQTHIKDARRVALEKVEDIQYQQNVLNSQKNRYNTDLNQLKSLLTQKELTLNDK
ncbi:MAG: hypothetical protein K6E76_03545 [Patescibacteria group bacterium]|nr:hypothetical protein [Patescibacteria group bacterium]